MSNNKLIPSILSIAGTDPSAGAGIQADIKAISATGAYAACVITALVAQNTQGVRAIEVVSPAFIAEQLSVVWSDLTIKAVKIGMLHRQETVACISKALQDKPITSIVLDPVMVAKDGSSLLDNNTVSSLKNDLLPLATLITPNIPEAQCLLAKPILTETAMAAAAKQLAYAYEVSVLLKGGHLVGVEANDVLFDYQAKQLIWYRAERIETNNTHGTGCTLSAAIASFLGQGVALSQAIVQAKNYLSKAIRAGAKLSIGQGNGPVDHFYALRR